MKYADQSCEWCANSVLVTNTPCDGNWYCNTEDLFRCNKYIDKRKTDVDNVKKFDDNKPRMDLLSSISIEGTATVLAFGAKKYDGHNWRKGMKWSRIFASLLRHTFAFLRGEDIDPESGLPHVDHMACNVMFLQEYYRLKKDMDDRYKSE